MGNTLANLSHGNITHDIKVEDAGLVGMFVDAPEIWYDTSELDLSIPYAGAGTYGLDVPSEFNDPSHPYSEVFNITNAIINDAGAVSAYDKAVAIQEFLLNGNGTTEYLRNYDGSGLPIEDLTFHLVVAAKEGRCTEFSTAFTTMLRLAGLLLGRLQDIMAVTGMGKVTLLQVYTPDSGLRFTYRPIRPVIR